LQNPFRNKYLHLQLTGCTSVLGHCIERRVNGKGLIKNNLLIGSHLIETIINEHGDSTDPGGLFYYINKFNHK
jgi:hypothetical protein